MKGISPIVATVLLIAVTMTIAGILAFWATQFARQHIAEFEKEEAIRECAFADFQVFRCSYDVNASIISLILQNPKRVDLKNITTFVVYKNDSILPPEGYLLGDLKGGIVKTFRIGNVSQDYREILITTHCPNVRKIETCI